jgi:transposase
VVLFVSEQLREGQIRGLEQHLEKRLKELQAWKDRLARARTGARNPLVIQRTIWRLSQGQHLQKVLKVDYDAKRQGADRLRFWVDEDARHRLETEVFGKRILITNRHEWADEEILLAYRGQSHVEAAFRQMKDDEHLALRPQFHWTDHKVKVHTFICLLALILARLIEHRARQKGFSGSLSHLLDLLGEVRLAMVLRPSGKRGGRPRCEWQLEDGRDEARSLYRELAPQE